MFNRVSDRLNRKKVLEEELQRLEDQRNAIIKYMAQISGHWKYGAYLFLAFLILSPPCLEPLYPCLSIVPTPHIRFSL